MKIKLINLNTWFGGKYTWDTIVDYITTEQPDILFLQEAYVSEKTDVPDFLRTIPKLQEVGNFHYAEFAPEFFLKTEDGINPKGNAILSKIPLLNARTEWLHGKAGFIVEDSNKEDIKNFSRNFLHCQVIVEEKIYNLITLHGVWAENEIETELQKLMGKKIVQYTADLQNVILAGDFNVNENTEAITGIEKNLVNLFKGQRQSSFNMKRKTNPKFSAAIVDFVFASPNIKVFEYRTSDADVSDHQSQVVLFDLS